MAPSPKNRAERPSVDARRSGFREGEGTASSGAAGVSTAGFASWPLSAILEAFGENLGQTGADDLARGLLDVVADARHPDELLVGVVDDADGVGIFVARL